MSMTKAEALDLPVVVDLRTAAQALCIGRSVAYEMARAGEFPVKVHRFRGQYRITRADLLSYLGISESNGAPPSESQPLPRLRAAR
jgi:hypothetical protein